MKGSSFLHTLTIIIGLLALVAIVTGWILKDKIIIGMTGNEWADKGMTSMFVAIWFALWTLINISKEDNKEEN